MNRLTKIQIDFSPDDRRRAARPRAQPRRALPRRRGRHRDDGYPGHEVAAERGRTRRTGPIRRGALPACSLGLARALRRRRFDLSAQPVDLRRREGGRGKPPSLPRAGAGDSPGSFASACADAWSVQQRLHHPLLRSQRLHRIQPRGATRRQHAGDKPDADRETLGECNERERRLHRQRRCCEPERLREPNAHR